MPKHLARAAPYSHGWVAQCRCGWLGSDQGTEEAAQAEAEMHECGEHNPWEPGEVKEWTPERHPTPDE